MKNSLFIALIFLVFASCEKLKHDNVIPADVPRLSAVQQQYKDLLVANTNGWFIEYAPTADKGAVSILMKFKADGTVSMISDRAGFELEKMSTYRVAGVNNPELIFDTYSVWSAIAESAGGNFEFLMYPQENGNITLKNVLTNINLNYTLRKATSADQDVILARAATVTTLKTFYENATGYFKNLRLTNIAAFFSLDVNTQQLTLSWQENGEVVSKSFSYGNLENGIRLAQPWTVGNISVRDINFGASSSNALQVTSAGNAGVGAIEVAHVPAFPYAGTADVFIFSNSLKPTETAVRFLGYTNNRDAISDALKPYYDAVTNALPTFWRIQFYNYSPITAPRNSITLVGKDAANANTFYYYYYALTKADGSHVNATYEDANTLGQTIANHPDVQALLTKIYPTEGVTIVPITSQKIRVVSRADSNHWVELTVSTPTPGAFTI